MPYIADRVVHDADAHTFEPPGWLGSWMADSVKGEVQDLLQVDPKIVKYVEKVRSEYDNPEYVARNEDDVTLRKGYAALGAFVKEERTSAIDFLGVQSQLVFTTAGLRPLARAEYNYSLDAALEVARAHNRGMIDFCNVDPRLLPVLYVPFRDIDTAAVMAKEAIEMGAAALMVPSACPKNHSPSHVGLDAVWGLAQEAGIPVVFHVGGGTHMNPTYKENGLAPVKDFTGGDGNFTSVSYMTIPEAPQQTLATMIFDGVLDRFPELKFGVIEMGAGWVPGWMRSMNSAAGAFTKNETRLQSLKLKPSEYVQRQVRVTPYPHEEAGWIIKNSAPEVALFSSDYPHTEGGRNPLKRFDQSLEVENCTADEIDKFYKTNFEDLMGTALKS